MLYTCICPIIPAHRQTNKEMLLSEQLYSLIFCVFFFRFYGKQIHWPPYAALVCHFTNLFWWLAFVEELYFHPIIITDDLLALVCVTILLNTDIQFSLELIYISWYVAASSSSLLFWVLFSLFWLFCCPAIENLYAGHLKIKLLISSNKSNPLLPHFNFNMLPHHWAAL